MYKKILSSATILSILLAYSIKAEVIHSTWVGGSEGSWEDIWNWEPNEVPHNIEGLKSYNVTISVYGIDVGLGQSHTIDALTCSGRVNLGGTGWLCILSGLWNFGHLSIDQVDVRGNVSNFSGAELELGEIDIKGSLYNGTGGTIIVYLHAVDVWGAEIQNGGTIFAFDGSLGETETFHNSGKIEMFDGGCDGHTIYNTGIIEGYGEVVGEQQINNTGIIKAAKGDLRLFGNIVDSNSSLINTGTLKNDVGTTLHISLVADVNNNGTIDINADGSVAFDCNLVNEPNATIKLSNGTLAATTITQKADANFAGFGGITGNVVIDPNALIKLTGPTNIVGDVNIEPSATLQISDGLTLVTGQTVCNGTIHMKGGYIIPQGGLSGNCNIIWEPGIYTNAADFNLDGQVNLEDFAYLADVWLWQTSWR